MGESVDATERRKKERERERESGRGRRQVCTAVTSEGLVSDVIVRSSEKGPLGT